MGMFKILEFNSTEYNLIVITYFSYIFLNFKLHTIYIFHCVRTFFYFLAPSAFESAPPENKKKFLHSTKYKLYIILLLYLTNRPSLRYRPSQKRHITPLYDCLERREITKQPRKICINCKINLISLRKCNLKNIYAQHRGLLPSSVRVTM